MKVVTLEQVLGKICQLPSLSLIVTELIASFNSKNIDTAYLVRKIEQDQSLAARVLRVANSAFFELPHRVGAVNEAVTVLGFNTVRSLALTAGIFNLFTNVTEDRFDRLAFWQHAIGTGVCAKVLTARLGGDQQSAYTAGLLHDIGKLVLYAYFQEVFNEILARSTKHNSSHEAEEKNLLGFDHAEIGYEVARQWKFPLEIQLAIRGHHNPDTNPTSTTDVVHVANTLCCALDIGSGGNDHVSLMSATAWERLGLSWASLPACLRDIDSINAKMNL